MWLAQPLLRRKLQRRGVQEPGYLHAIEERFGHYPINVPVAPGPTVWVHAVSLGETRAAAMLVSALREQIPGMRLLLTHGTATGRAEGAKLLQPGDLQTWQPWDTVGAVQRFLRHFKPSVGVLMETEVWPNLAHGCQQNGVPLVLANARLSDKSLRQSERLAWLARPAFAALTAVWAQTAQDAERLARLGAPVRGVLGNIKFDATPDVRLLDTGREWHRQQSRPVVMFASSREGEELAFLLALKEFMAFKAEAKVNTWQDASESIANQVQWLIVPRHPQRFDAVADMICAEGFEVSRRSQWPVSGPGDGASSTIWIGDSLGEMALYYGLADVALLGGSFEPLGGQNLIEAAACGCPVVMGPHTFNFADAAVQAEQAGAARRVADMAQALVVAAQWVAEPQRLQTFSQASEDFAQAHRGATLALAQAIAPLARV
jgi:3-deoxy-D-manno-octulosonic-acid transferase